MDSFRTAANQAAISSGGSSNLAPSDIFDTGLSIASKVADQTSLFSPASSLGLIVCALVILISFALIAAFLVVSLVESYVVISAGVLLMGFGGSRFTKDYAVRTMTYAVSVGAKLFVLQLLIALGQQIFQTLSQSFEAKTTDIFVVVGSAIVMLALVKIVPEMIQALINGASGRQFPASRERRRHRGRSCRCWRHGLWRRHGGAKRRPACQRTACGCQAQWHGSADRLRTRAPVHRGHGRQCRPRSGREYRRPLERAGAFRDAARPDVRGAGTQGCGPRGGAPRAADLSVAVFTLMFTVASVSNLAFDDRS